MKIPLPGSSLAVATILLVAAIAVPIPRALGQTQTLSPASAEPVEVVPYAVIERGAHYNRIAHVLALTNNLGRAIYKTNGYTQIGTGLNHLVNGEYIESQENIEITSNGAQATNAAHQVFFSGNANSQTAIQLNTPDGKQLSSHVVSLGYLDPVTGSMAIISQLQDSIGQLVSPNEAIYTNALGGTNGCIADIYYRFTKAGLEQNIILRTQLPAPEAFSMNSADGVLLQVTTAFGDSPAPVIITNAGALAQGVLDEFLDFGAMQVGRGKAFLIGDNPPDASAENVYKQWVVTETGSYLVEQIPLTPSVIAQLQTLRPPAATGTNGNGAMLRMTPSTVLAERAGVRAVVPNSKLRTPRLTLANLASRLALPVPHFSPAPSVPFRLARSDTRSLAAGNPHPHLGKGFLVDYSILSSQSGFIAQSDTTYFLNTNSSVNLSGIITFEGGAVLKFGSNASLTMSSFSAPITWLGSQFRPVVLTAQDDNTVGETITNSTGIPSGYYANTALSITGAGNRLAGFRISYAKQALAIYNCNGTLTLEHGQIVSCQNGITAGDAPIKIENVLFANVVTNVNSLPPADFAFENATFSASSYFVGFPPPGSTNVTFEVTNCIFANVTNLWNFKPTNFVGAYNGFYNTTNFGSSTVPISTYPFQTVGAGSYYLANGSPCVGAGTTNIDYALLSDLAQRTTYPPVVFFEGGYHTNSLALLPQAPRDTNSPVTLGYHYDPIDFAFGLYYVTNASITAGPGTVIASFSTNGWSNGYGLGIGNGATLQCQGTPNAPVVVLQFNCVQEQSSLNWVEDSYAMVSSEFYGHLPATTISCRFTDFSVPAQDSVLVLGVGNIACNPMNFQDCQFEGGKLTTTYAAMNFTNCLLGRVNAVLYSSDGNVPDVRNNLFFGGTFDFDPTPVTNAFVKDNLFDHADVPDESSDYGTYNGGNNAYVTNSLITNPAFLNPTNITDKILTNSPVYQSAWLGNFYYPSGYQLIDAGHTNANLLQLWHFCTTTNEVQETNSIVDVGLHFVAVGTNGLPLSTGGSGIPDYLADSNGNGLYDSATDLSNWQTNNTSGSSDGVNDYIKWIQGRNIKVAALPVADTNGIVGLQVYTPLH